MKACIIFLLFFLQVLYSGTTGKLAGVVIDKENKTPAIGCNVFLVGSEYGTATNERGEYVIFNIEPGIYDLRVSMIGFSDQIIKNIQVHIDLTLVNNFSLVSEEISGDIIVVHAKQTLLKKDLTASTAIVDKSQIEKLNVTEVSEIMDMQAGYVDGHIRGGRSGEIAYWIDGIPVTDIYDGSAVVDVNANMIEEMHMISGAFNAEYGKAMSGIVNIVTSDGNNDLSGNVNLYVGDFLSFKDDIFLGINKFNPFTTHNIEASLNGAFIKDKLFFNTNFRTIYYQGQYNGKQIYLPNSVGTAIDDNGDEVWHVLGTDFYYDSLYVDSDYRNQFGYHDKEDIDSLITVLQNNHQDSSGDHSIIPMEWNRKKYAQFKLTYKPNFQTKIRYSLIYDDVDFQEYDRMYSLNPNGNLNKFRNGWSQIIQLTKSFNQHIFFNLGLSQFRKKYNHQTYDSKDQFVHELLATPYNNYSFLSGGSNNHFFERETLSKSVKFDIHGQLNSVHQIKLGFEYKLNQLFYHNYTLQPSDNMATIHTAYESPYLSNAQIDPLSSLNTSQYQFKPIESSIYIQDKIEYDNIIINAGMRFDYFDSKGKVLADESDPSIYNPIKPKNIFHDDNENGIQDENELAVSIEERKEYWYKTVSPKYAISPRLGFSFPFSSEGVIYFSYGHFFQAPRFELLYYNSDFDLGLTTGNVGVIGNADLEPEKTISYEMGMQYLLNQASKLDITLYCRDIRNLTGTSAAEISMFGGTSTYSKFENSDFGFVKGLVLSMQSDINDHLSYNVFYTFQEAKGTASDPYQAQSSLASGIDPEIFLVPLDWDQTHTINSSLYYQNTKIGISLIGRFESGMPYTPTSSEDISSLTKNLSTKPFSWNVDLKAHYFINKHFKAYLRVLNIFDYLGHVNVYNDSGVSNRTEQLLQAQKLGLNEHVNTVQKWYNNETFYSKPRNIEMGLNYAF